MPLLQIRDVPEDTHRMLKARAAAAGVSLSEYARTALGLVAQRPTPEELAARIAARGPVVASESTDDAVRAIRSGGE